jgi:hypothetical protein
MELHRSAGDTCHQSLTKSKLLSLPLIPLAAGGSTANDEKLKEILVGLVSGLEDLAASQGSTIATLRSMSKGTISVSDAQSATASTKASNRAHFDKYRKAISEL